MKKNFFIAEHYLEIGGAPHVRFIIVQLLQSRSFFILDGPGEENALLRDYFPKFDRYVFFENSSEEIRYLTCDETIVSRLQWQ